MRFREKDEAMIRERWGQNTVFADAWNTNRSGHLRQEKETEFQAVLEAELLPGELSAVTFRVGCYIVRKALRIYNIHGPVYSPELETPAKETDAALVRRDLNLDNGCAIGLGLRPSWEDRLRVTQEISARHCDSPSSSFTYICRAAEARDHRWCEIIGPIYTAKVSASIPDEYASLLVCLTFVGSSHTDDTWHRLDPTGKITTFTTNSPS